MDQVSSLTHEPNHFQIGEPGAPSGGSVTCTDCSIAMIVRHDKGIFVSARTVREAAAPDKSDRRGLNAYEALRGLYNLGVRGYSILIGATASDVLKATDRGVVLVSVGYDGWPTLAEAVVGGKTDLGFRGPHATTNWGRRRYISKPASWPVDKPFHPGWYTWARDPDHHWGDAKPPYDKFSTSYLVRAMDALVGNGGWQVRCAIGRFPTLTRAKAMSGVEPHALDQPPGFFDEETAIHLDLPDFGTGQTGGTS